jgi:hypothetical protein
MRSIDLGASLRPDTLAFVPAKHPTLRVETTEGLPILFVGGRTVLEIFALSAVYRLQGGLPALGAARLRLARVPRLKPARAAWPTDPQAFLAEALAALAHAAGARLELALAAVHDLVRARLLGAGRLEAIESGSWITIHAGGGTVEWIDARHRPSRRETIEIQEPRLPAVCAGLRLPTGAGTLARIEKIRIPPVAATAHERLRIADQTAPSQILDALLAEEAAATAARGRRPRKTR